MRFKRQVALIALALLFVSVACANATTRTLPVVRATERQNHATVTLRRGQKLQVVLHSTYWQFEKLSAASALRFVHAPAVHPAGSCIPGGGCGTVTALYGARARGVAFVMAHRSSCGEAVGCTAATGQYKLRVVVR